MENKQGKKTTSEIVGAVSGVLSTLIGLTVITAWGFHIDNLVLPFQTSGPMQPNAAFGFVFTGIGLLAISFGIRRITVICGTIVALFGLLTLIEYILDVNLGIDALFLDPHIVVNSTHPGRMARKTALEFLLTGSALLLLTSFIQFKLQKLFTCLLSSIITAIAALSVFGYILDFEAFHGWSDFARMALHTAVSFTICGIGLFSFSIAKEKNAKGFLPRWLPIPVGVSIAMMALVLWHAMSSYENNRLKSELEDKAANISHLLTESLNNQVNGIIRIAKRWEIRGGTPHREWSEDASWYLKHRKGSQAIYWVNSDFKIQWVVPSKSERILAGQAALGVESLKNEFKSASPNSDPFIVPANNLPHGDNGFIVSVPIFENGRFAGLIQSEYGAQSYLSPIFQNHQEMSINLLMAVPRDIESLNYGAPLINDSSIAVASIETDFSGASLCITAWPKSEFQKEFKTLLPAATLFTGLTSALLISLLIHFYQQARTKSLELSEANQSLELRVEARTNELKERDEFTRQWLSQCTDGAWDWDLEKNNVKMTPQFKALLGYDNDEIDESVDNWRKLIPPMDLQVADKAYNDYINLGQRYAYQLRWIHKNGSMVWTLCRGEGIKDESGKIVRMVGTLTDISQLKMLEEKLTHWAEELERKNGDLERFNRLAVGREKRMIELKARINSLSQELGKNEPYNIDFAKDAGFSTSKITI